MHAGDGIMHRRCLRDYVVLGHGEGCVVIGTGMSRDIILTTPIHRPAARVAHRGLGARNKLCFEANPWRHGVRHAVRACFGITLDRSFMPCVTLSCLRVNRADIGDGKVEHRRLFVLHIDIDHWSCSSNITGVVVVVCRVWEC
jgi:hypothetical protein